MKRTVCMLLLLLLALTALPVGAAPEGPVITLQPQSPNYPHYSVAIYTVKARGDHLTATWYLDWQGQTYCISNLGGAMQPWEAYAGESYGPRQPDGETFLFIFEGIESELDGAYIWCVIEDGHYDVTSQKARICVGNSAMPPEIVSIPPELTVGQGEWAELRCVARSTDGSQLSFLWYETDTGRLEDIRAVNRGEETADYLFCDTSTPGTRNYLCMVQSDTGGVIYSSVVPVTVLEKLPVETTVTPETTPETTAPPETTPETTAPPETTPPEIAPETTAPAVQSPTDTPTTPVTEAPPAAQPTAPSGQEESLPWWLLALIAAGAAGLGVGVAIVLTRKRN